MFFGGKFCWGPHFSKGVIICFFQDLHYDQQFGALHFCQNLPAAAVQQQVGLLDAALNDPAPTAWARTRVHGAHVDAGNEVLQEGAPKPWVG